MRKVLLALAAVAAVGVALPAVSNTASAETVIIKKNHGWHHGWRHRDRVVVREGWHHRRPRVVVREGWRHRHHPRAAIVVR